MIDRGQGYRVPMPADLRRVAEEYLGSAEATHGDLEWAMSDAETYISIWIRFQLESDLETADEA